jgi:large subunit ribosomal protein L16
MLSPNVQSTEKMQRGRMKGKARNNRLVHGEYGIQALEPVWLTSRQIEAVRRTITHTKRTGKLWIKVFQIKLLLLVQKNHVWDLEKVLLIIG